MIRVQLGKVRADGLRTAVLAASRLVILGDASSITGASPPVPSPTHSTVAQQLLQLATRLGVRYLFTNLGSDHPAFIEGFAQLAARGEPMPEVIVCPHEMTALSAAHGYAMITRRPQLVLVHVDVGTQNLGGSIHNAARGRVPAIIVAGLSPVTANRERTGSRNEFIHYIQDTPRQQEIVAQYMKWSYELRAPEMVDAVALRAVQIATTVPEGPVYLTGAREIWDASVAASKEPIEHWPGARMGGLPEAAVPEIYRALTQAKRPIAIAAYLGRQPEAVKKLIELSERIGIGVCEVSPEYLNFPGDHAHHLSYRRNTLVDEADLILMLDVDVPWIPTKVQPAAGAQLIHIDADPVKDRLGFWHFPSHRSYQADTLQALEQLVAQAKGSVPGRDERYAWIAEAKRRVNVASTASGTGPIAMDELTAAIRELVNERTIVLFEEPSGTEAIPSVLRMRRPGSFFASGGAGLGWGINAATGAKLAKPDAEVIAVVGDGCYLFGVPSSAYWVASTYKTPHLTVVYNNGGWHSPKLSTLWVHPEGTANRNDTFWVTMGAGARLADIAAAAGDVEAHRVVEREQLKPTLAAAMQTVRAGRPAVVEVAIAPISGQILG
jgi:acetolactate synthase-1/2/3 large subunit